MVRTAGRAHLPPPRTQARTSLQLRHAARATGLLRPSREPRFRLCDLSPLVAPALRVLAGERLGPALRLRGTLAKAVKKAPGRRDFQRGIFTPTAQGFSVEAFDAQDSHLLSGLAAANCLLDLPFLRAISAGAEVTFTSGIKKPRRLPPGVFPNDAHRRKGDEALTWPSRRPSLPEPCGPEPSLRAFSGGLLSCGLSLALAAGFLATDFFGNAFFEGTQAARRGRCSSSGTAFLDPRKLRSLLSTELGRRPSRGARPAWPAPPYWQQRAWLRWWPSAPSPWPWPSPPAELPAP